MKPIPILYSPGGPLDYRIAADTEPLPRQVIRPNDSVEGLYRTLGPPSHQETLPIGLIDALYYSNRVIAHVHNGRDIVLGFYLHDEQADGFPWTHWAEVRLDRSARNAPREEIVELVLWEPAEKEYVRGCNAVHYITLASDH